MGRSRWRGWFFRTIFPAVERNAGDRLARLVPDLVRARIVRHYLERTAGEDHDACERLQEVAAQAGRQPILGAQETRVGWFTKPTTASCWTAPSGLTPSPRTPAARSGGARRRSATSRCG